MTGAKAQRGDQILDRSATTPPSAIEVPELSLAKGGGAHKPIGEGFRVNAVSGTTGLALPLPATESRTAPALSLRYDSGNGNGAFGLGWSLDMPAVVRRTDKRLPRYHDDDVFSLSDGDELVPVLRADGTRWETSDGGVHVRRYRPRIEGSFALIERIWVEGEPTFYWKTTSGANHVTFFGLTAESRVADPADPSRVARWLPSLGYDDHGNVLVHEYKAEDGAEGPLGGHDANRYDELGRPRFTQRYLKRTRYGNREPWAPASLYAPAISALTFAFELVFDYGDHGDAVADGAQQAIVPFAEDRLWPARSDAHSDYRAGFEVRTLRLCRRVLMFHRFAELGVQPQLVRSLDLEYATSSAAEVTYLAAAVSRGYVRVQGELYDVAARRPQRFTYQPLAWHREVRELASDDVAGLPEGLGEAYRWIDLWNEGIAGVLSEHAGALHYKQNLGDGTFTAPRPLLAQPSLHGLAEGELVVADLGGDGCRQLASTHGYFELDPGDHAWQPYRAFDAIPRVDTTAPDVLRIDLDGDGRIDLLVTEDVAIRWYRSLGRAGYAEGECAPPNRDEEQGPVAVWNDRTQRIFLADLSGDGLADIVRVRSGEVCYWPNLGYGRFGAKVTMERSPALGADFDPQRVQLADLSGTGASDLLYLDGARVQVWLNLAGNAWSEARAIEMPDTVLPARVQVLDLLGNGTPCLAWSSPLPGDARAPLRYIDLFGGKKPHLLVEHDNGAGRTTTVGYRCSTRFYLDDARAGTPWRTTLPFPVQCVARVETREQVTESLLVQEYSYHHGYYDHVEREFRGFARVDQRDTETFARWVTEGASNIVDARFHQPVVLTRSWFHTGAAPDGGDPLGLYAADYWFANPALLALAQPEPEPALPPAQVPPGLAADEVREAHRACKGMLLRREVFALDAPQGATAEQRIAELTPYSVAMHDARVQLVQPRAGEAHAVFLAGGSETLTLAYERRPADARVQHVLQLAHDRYGTALVSAQVVYGRRQAVAGLPMAVAEAQQAMHVTITERTLTDDDLTATASPYRLPVECESRTYELLGLAPPVGLVSLDALVAAVTSAVAIGYEIEAPLDGQLRKRLVEHARVLHLDDDLATPRPFGKASPLGLVYASYQLAFTEPVLRRLLGDERLAELDLEATLAGQGGYVHFDDGHGTADAHWWVWSGTVDYLDAARAPLRFYQPARYVDPRGAATEVRYLGEDATRTNPATYWAQIALRRDAAGNETRVTAFDYRVLAPSEMVDENENRSAVVFDELGRVVAAALLGTGNDADGLDLLSARLAVRAAQLDQQARYFAQGDAATAAWLLADATTRWVYDDTAVPMRAASIARERHVADLSETGDALALQLAFEYTGGDGRAVLSKVRVPEGWLGNGRTVVDNKGRPIQQFEPYVSATHAFEPAQLLVDTGVSPLLTYDSAGRHVRTDYPDGTFDLTRFDAWSQELYDQNDTVLASGWYAERLALPAGDPERIAADQAALHADTPLVLHLDSLGRQLCSVAHHRGKDAEDQVVETRPTLVASIDIEGNLLGAIDARGNALIARRYDLLGRALYSSAMDTGERWTLVDAAGQPLVRWDSRGARARHVYDSLHRPVQQWLRVAGEPEILVVAQEWGEVAPDAAMHNLRGKLWRIYDPSGLFETVSYDLRGNRIESRRRYATTYDALVAWPEADRDALLEAETFRTRARFDALDRPVRMFSPDTPDIPASEIALGYDAGGRLSTVTASIRGGAATSFVDDITYNPKGQRLAIRYGNGIATTYEYDPLTFRLRRATSSRGGQALQDLHYTYDPVANIVGQRDAAQQTTYFAGAVASPSASYEYDSLYRLVRARGREHVGQNAPASEWDAERARKILPGDAQAMQPYEERYEYDLAGNLTRLAHAAASGGQFQNRWTRDYSYEAATNRLASTTVGGTTLAYAYNEHGSMSSMPHLQAMDWDGFERLQHVRQGTLDAFYSYDDHGRRTRKVVHKQGGIREVRLYLGPFEIFRRYRNGELILERETQHVMDAQRRIAVVETRTVGDDDAPARSERYQLGNHLESAVLEVDEAGEIVSYEEYHPFGTTAWQAGRSVAEVSLKRYRYCGLERDDESGLGYHGARYYAPWLGRWTSADPTGVADGPNVYAYATNSPVVLYDPSGIAGEKPNEFDRVIMQMTDPELHKFMSGLEPRLQQAMAAGATGAFAKRAQAMVQKYNLQSVQITSKTRTIGDVAAYKNQGKANYLDILGSRRRADEAEHALATAGAKVLLEDASNKWKRESPTIVLAEAHSRMKTPTDNKLSADFKAGKITAEEWLQHSTTNAYRSWFEARAQGVAVPTADEMANAILEQKRQLQIRYYQLLAEKMERIQQQQAADAAYGPVDNVSRFQGMVQIRLDQTADAQVMGEVRTSIVIGGGIVLLDMVAQAALFSGAVIATAPVAIGSVPAAASPEVVAADAAVGAPVVGEATVEGVKDAITILEEVNAELAREAAQREAELLVEEFMAEQALAREQLVKETIELLMH